MKATIVLRIETDEEFEKTFEEHSDKDLLKFVTSELRDKAWIKSVKGYIQESNYNKPQPIVYKRK